MQYQVPQFIEIEDKIIGPLTLKQFLYLAGGGGVCLVFFTLLPFFLAAVLAIPVVALALMLAFYQVNGRPFIIVLEHSVYYLLNTKLYLWKQREISASQNTSSSTVNAPIDKIPMLNQRNKLQDLSTKLVTKLEKPTHPSTQSFKL